MQVTGSIMPVLKQKEPAGHGVQLFSVFDFPLNVPTGQGVASVAPSKQ